MFLGQASRAAVRSGVWFPSPSEYTVAQDALKTNQCNGSLPFGSDPRVTCLQCR